MRRLVCAVDRELDDRLPHLDRNSLLRAGALVKSAARAPEVLTTVQLAARASTAAALAFFIAQTLGLSYPIFAFIAAVIVTDLTPAQTRELGVRRLAATLLGALFGAMLSGVLPPGPVALGVSILLVMIACRILLLADGARLAGYISGIIVIDQSLEPWHYAGFRLVETALGVLVAWGISYVPKLLNAEAPSADAE